MSEKEQQLVVETEKPTPEATTESVAIISMIERAARDPAVDITKMERLFEMQERVCERMAKSSYLKSFAELQADLPAIEKRGKGHSSKFVKFEDFVSGIKSHLSNHGFSLSYRIAQSDGAIQVTGVLGHRDGHSEETSISLPADTSGNKNIVQAHGSSVSYGKRYTGVTLLGIATEDEDDDGNRAGAGPTISGDQVMLLRDKMESVETSEAQFCKYLGVSKLADLAAKHYDRAVTALNKKGEQKL